MTTFNKILTWAGLEPDETEEVLEMENSEPVKTAAPKREKSRISSSFSRQSSANMEVVITRLDSYEQARDIVYNLKERKPVIINLELLEPRAARRVIDFLCGAILGLEGTLQKVTDGIFVATPNNIDIATDIVEEYESELEY